MWIKYLLVVLLILLSGCAVKPTEPEGNTKASTPTTQTETSNTAITILNVIRLNAYSSDETFVVEYMNDSDKSVVCSTYISGRTYVFLDCPNEGDLWVTMNDSTSSVEIHVHCMKEIKVIY